MSYIKIVSDLFLEKVELTKFQNFITKEGHEADFLNNTESFGVVRNNYFDPNNKYLKVEQSNVLGIAKLNGGYAYDKNHKRIALLSDINIPIPNDGNFYWLKIKHAYNSKEVGTVSVGGVNKSIIFGIGTNFTEVLRGQPNFPSKIKFKNSQNYTQEYEVLQVIDNENALIQGVFETLESNLEYTIVGTFTPGYYPNAEDKEIFQYDSIIYSLEQEGIMGQQPAFVKDEEFLIAKIKNLNNNLDIIDNRYNFQLKTTNEVYNKKIETKQNPLIAIESIKLFNFSGEDIYVVNIDWKLNIISYAANNSTSSINIISGNGGKYSVVNDILANDFDNWRLYYENGDFSNIKTTIKNSDGTVTIFLEELKSESPAVCVTPDADSIDFLFNFEINSQNTYVKETKTFLINQIKPTVVFDQKLISKINQFVEVKYKYQSGKRTSGLMHLNKNPYYIETAFNTAGVLTDVTKVLNSSDLFFNGGVDYGYLDGWRVFYPNQYQLLYGINVLTLAPNLVNSNLKYKLFGANTVRIQGRISFQLGTNQSFNDGLAPNGIMFKTPFTWLDDLTINNTIRSWINSFTYKTSTGSRKYEMIRTETYYDGQNTSNVEDGVATDMVACKYIKSGIGMLSDPQSSSNLNTIYTNNLPVNTLLIMDIDFLTYFDSRDLNYVNGINGDEHNIQQGLNGVPILANYSINYVVHPNQVGINILVTRIAAEQNYKVKVDYRINYKTTRRGGFLNLSNFIEQHVPYNGSIIMNMTELTKPDYMAQPEGLRIVELSNITITGIELIP